MGGLGPRFERVLVTGGTGFIGGHVVRALLERGEQVRCLVRPSSHVEDLAGPDVELVPGDILDPASLRRAAEGCEAVFHCAADYRLWARDPDSIYETNVEGTRNVLRAASEAGARRVVHTSSVGALGLEPDDTPADETTPVTLEDVIGHYKRSKFLAERVAEEWAERGLPVVIVNPSTPVGEGDVKPTPTGRIIVDFLRGRMPAYVDTGLNLVDVRDVAAGHLLAADAGVVGERYILGNRNLTLKEILEMLAAVSGRSAPRVRLPGWVAMAFAAADEAWSRVRDTAPRVSMESVRMSRHRMWFDAGKAVRELGLPQSSVEGALARAVEWFRARNYVAA